MNALTKNIKINWNFTNIILFAVYLTSTMIVLQVKSITFFILFQVVLCFWLMVKKRKVFFIKDFVINLIFCELIFSTLLCALSSIPDSYKRAAIYETILIIPSYFAISYISHLIRNNNNTVSIIKNGILAMCSIQIFYGIFQYIMYTIFEKDINQMIFVDTFHMVENATFYKMGFLFMPSGLSWHPVIIAPIVVLAFFMFENIWMKSIAVLMAVICGNGTALIGIVLCVLILCFDSLIKIVKGKRKGSRKILFTLLILSIIAIVLEYKFGIFKEVSLKLVYLYQRIFTLVDDGGSAYAHIRYYTTYPTFARKSSLTQLLFGYGEGSSGYIFGVIYDQYTTLSSWVVESDFINILISRGIIGFICYYSMILFVMIKGFRINRKYAYIAFIIMIEGITYNIQFEWMFFLMLSLYVLVKYKIDLFIPIKNNLTNNKNS